MKLALIIAAAVALSACASAPTPTPNHVIEIQVPCAAAAPENRPPLPPKRLAGLDPTAPGEVVKAFAISTIEHRSRAEQLEKLLDACK